MIGTLIGIAVAIFTIKFLNIFKRSQTPKVYCLDSDFNKSILSLCPILQERYIPPLLWGKNGHFQSASYAMIGKLPTFIIKGIRSSFVMEDGATITFDFYPPLKNHPLSEEITLLVCPGLGNSCESSYIRSFTFSAQKIGYSVAVLNHLGTIHSIKLTSPRLYSYGSTREYHRMVTEIKKHYPETKLIAVGFSMGANIVVKYLGEDPANQDNFICAISACQGYGVERNDLEAVAKTICARRLYLYFMTHVVKRVIYAHKDILLAPEALQKFNLENLDVDKISNCKTLVQLDDIYTRHIYGFPTLESFYHNVSSRNYISNIHIPMLLFNAIDDPLIPEISLDCPKEYVAARPNAMFVTTSHGGHMGYREGGVLNGRAKRWLDRIIVQYINAVIVVSYGDGQQV